MKLSSQGSSGWCTLHRGEIQPRVGGAVFPSSGPPVFACRNCIDRLADLLGSVIADTVANADEAHPALNVDDVLNSFVAQVRSIVAQG